MNKFTYEYIVQGLYYGKWEDLTAHDSRKSARCECGIYNQNDPAPHRVIFRRTLAK